MIKTTSPTIKDDEYLRRPRSSTNISPTIDGQDHLIELYRAMVTAREVDIAEAAFVKQGAAFFHVSGAGHEAVAAINEFLTPDDWLHCHYRDKALMIARGIEPEMFFHSLFAKDVSHSRGRQMSAHMSDAARKILSLVGPVGNNALQAVGVALEIKHHAKSPIVLCAMGDGTAQQGEVLEAIAEAVRWELPVLFLIEDNRYSISVTTNKRTFFSLPDGRRPDCFYGITIVRVDGRDCLACRDGFARVVADIRASRRPGLMIMDVERLNNHTNADDQTVYRKEEDIRRGRRDRDPIPILHRRLVEAGIDAAALAEIDSTIRRDVRLAARNSQRQSDPAPVFDAKRPLPDKLLRADMERRDYKADRQLTMIEAIREVFRLRLHNDSRVTLYGEDIEDPKGDVFGLTRGLSEQFPGRVKNSPLTESTIVGVSIGRALAGGRPVAFLQFADFLPLAYNQIISELGSMYWRTGGAWQCPVIIMITCGGYRPGLGPFHAQTLEAVAAHTPGVDVFMPSTAADAAGLLNAAFESERPTLFFYPKSCLNDRSATTSPDIENQLVPIGPARLEGNGQDVTFVAWGNTVALCRKAVKTLEAEGVQSTLIDLRSLSPWDESTVLESVRRTGKLIVVHEDNHTCGMGAEIVATVCEKIDRPVKVVRVTRPDTYIPFNFANQLEVLPSFRRVLTAAAKLCDIEVEWQEPDTPAPGTYDIEALGVSPSDESVTITKWHVAIGQPVATDELLASIEADKAAGELLSPVSGVVKEILVDEGAGVQTGTLVARITVDDIENSPVRPATHDAPGTPCLKRKPRQTDQEAQSRSSSFAVSSTPVGIAGIGVSLGSRTVSNDDLLANFPATNDSEIIRGTGIYQRRRVAPDENALSLAVGATRTVLRARNLEVRDLDLIVCSTGTPLCTTPSLACQILHELGGEQIECPAYDISAACSGYLYGLQIAHDFLNTQPEARVLLVTSEVLSPRLNPEDFDTAIIFGDAATATVLCGHHNLADCRLQVYRPALSGSGESGEYLCVPLNSGDGNRYISMNGTKVFKEGVKRMLQMLRVACSRMDMSVKDLDMIIPHQANRRIIDAIRKQLDLPEVPIFSNIEQLGNTSSCTIPLCLHELLLAGKSGSRWGLTAFGGGFTYGAAIIKVE